MAHLLSPDDIETLMRALAGSCSVPIGDGEVRVVCAPLPGRAIVSATRVDGILWICLDLDKPSAHRHAGAMLREWRAFYLLSPTGLPRQLAEVERVRTPLLTVPIDIPRLREAVTRINRADIPAPRRPEPCPARLVS